MQKFFLISVITITFGHAQDDFLLEFNSTEPGQLDVATSSTEPVDVESTSILFSGFYAPSTTPPPAPSLRSPPLTITADPVTRLDDLHYMTPDPSTHPCRRDCLTGEKMSCEFRFQVEWYEALSKACFDCPRNVTDCYREDCIPADGIERPLVVVNRQMPGPIIEVCLGDDVEIEVVNGLMTETTSIHWHGLHQRESPYMDGVPYVSQCPILPKATFVYQYTAANPGTHFWHAHSGTQRADGMYGALIVRTPSASDPHRPLYDEDLSEHVILTTDWSHTLTMAVFTGHHFAAVDNKPPTLLINGRGVFNKTPPASFTVQRGKRYRFRLINAGVLNCPIELSIDNHTMTVINSDGSDFKPVQVDSLVSYAGERWDFIVKANQAVDNYWMRYRGLMDCDERFTSAHSASVLHYDGSSQHLPSSSLSYELGRRKGKSINGLNAGVKDASLILPQMHSLPKAGEASLRPKPDRKIILSYDFHPIDNKHFYKTGKYGFHQVLRDKQRVYTPQLNHVSLSLPSFPLLSQHSQLKHGMLCSQQDLSDCAHRHCECINVVDLKLGEVVELILIDLGVTYDANHPFHLHGHMFRVVGMDRVGRSTTVEEVMALDANGSIYRNLIDPPVKDTVTVPDGGYTIVRFIADNPGYWMFHCHLEFHVELGMALIFKVGDHSQFPPVPNNFPRCGDFRPSSSPSSDEHHQISWTYNATHTPDGSFTLTDYWWPHHNSASPSPTDYSNIIIICTLLLFSMVFNLH